MREVFVSRAALLHSLLFYCAILLFRMALDVMYVIFVQPLFEYMGFQFSFEATRYFESWVLLLLACGFLTPSLRKPSDFFLLMLALGLIVPMTSLFGLDYRPRLVVYSTILCFIMISLVRSGTVLRFPTVRDGTGLALAISFVLTLSVLIWIIFSGGLSYLSFDLIKVYELRGQVSEVIGQGWFSYLNVWVFKVFNILLFAYALYKRYFVAAAFIFGLQGLFFGVSAHKAVLFYPLIVVAIWYYLGNTRNMAVVPFGMFAVVVVSGIAWWVTDLTLIGSLFVRRLFFVHAFNAFDYFEFFSQNQFVYWSNSIASAFVNYPYHVSPPELIGEWRGEVAHVNNTFIANGYMHAGLPGIAFYALIVGFIFRIIDSLVDDGVELWMGLAVTIVPIYSLLLSTDLPTALMTHGLGIAVLLLFLMRDTNRAEPECQTPDPRPAAT